MHEMSLAEGIVQLVEDAARADGSTKVKAVWLEIGRLAAVEKEALRFCFDAVTRDTIAEGNVAVSALYEPCPVCGSYQIQVTGGNEMRVKEFEVE